MQPRLLIIDDDPDDLELLSYILEDDYDVTRLTDAREGLRRLKHEHFDVVLSDVRMPILSGFDVIESIRSLNDMASMPVILISNLSDTEDIVRGLNMGASDYITKPPNPSMVRARVQNQVMLKRLMDERQHTIQQLIATQETRDRFFRIASHDLKGPIHNVGMAHSALKTALQEGMETTEYHQMIDMSLENMRQMIAEFLETAVIQSGMLDIRLECTPIESVVADTLLQFDATAQRKNIRLIVENQGGMVVADGSKLVQVLSNLVSNAIKYSPPGSTVRLWTEYGRDDHLRICVADQGPGIPVAEFGKLFAEFSKLSTRPTANESRTGLGLWIVKHLMSLQNGDVGVVCPPEGGSIFWVELAACE